MISGTRCFFEKNPNFVNKCRQLLVSFHLLDVNPVSIMVELSQLLKFAKIIQGLTIFLGKM